MKKLPLGLSDFKTVIEDNYYYVDKSLLIKELLETPGQVILIPRPRRFGKTLNLSMLKYFFGISNTDNKHLFQNTYIGKEKKYMELQGQYPIIYLTFKDVKENNWESSYKKIREVIAKEFEHHLMTIQKNLSAHKLTEYMSIITKDADIEVYSRSLLDLTNLLSLHYNNQKVIILIDEYDAPIHAGFTHGFYNEIIQFMRSLLTSALKDNQYLEKGVLTGILRTAKEGIFSGLNNLSVYTLLDTEFEDKFGFTEQEVKQLLTDWEMRDQLPEIQAWYNGYKFGNITIYNPWSLLSCVSKKGTLKPYWLNTSDNQIIKKLISLASSEVKEELELLLNKKEIEKEITEAVIFPGIENNSKALWSLLLFSGYLTYSSCKLVIGKTYCNLTIPNQEIEILYKELITEVFERTLTSHKVNIMLRALTTGDMDTFQILLQEFLINSISMYDLPSNEPEKTYHLFVLGLLIFLSDQYQVKSNRESGLGRYDIMLIPKDITKLGIVIEFKKTAPKETLEMAAQRALEQIKEKQYALELKNCGIKYIKLIGIAFEGKNIFVQSENA